MGREVGRDGDKGGEHCRRGGGKVRVSLGLGLELGEKGGEH